MGAPAAELPVETKEQGDGAPVEGGAEATRTADHLFEYSRYVHAGTGAEECEHCEDGKCQEPDHFHVWVCLPNKIQARDIQEKARAAKARRKRALRDAGTQDRPASDAYVTLESELDDLMAGDRETLIAQVAEREINKRFGELVVEVREEDRFENYEQDREEWQRLSKVPEEDRDAEEFAALDARLTEFGNAIEERVEVERKRELDRFRQMADEALRSVVRDARVAGEAQDQHTHTYYTWLTFVGTRQCSHKGKRYFQNLEDFRAASPEAVDALDNAIRDLEGRTVRGDAAGN